jgi:hypothetical protein
VTFSNLLSDTYDRKARLFPALLVLMPVVACVVALTPATLSGLESGAGALGCCGGAFLLAQLARDAGKRREQALFAAWGGMPSVAILRHVDTRLDRITKARYHRRLSALVRGTKAPTPRAEADDPAGADQTYAAWSAFLRVNTRDKKKYALLFQENVSYGYRRNAWGLRPLGIVASLISALAALTVVCLRYRRSGIVAEGMAAAATLSVVFLLLWVFRFTSDWVHVPAQAYAERLMETIEGMGGGGAAAETS